MFRLVRDATRLTARERALALRALGLLVVAHFALRLRGFPAVRRGLDRVRRRRSSDRVTAVECEHAMRRAARIFPYANCLARALAAAALLRRHGLASLLTITVATGDSGEFQAHAWLGSDGVVVTGAGELTDGRPLLRDPIGSA